MSPRNRYVQRKRRELREGRVKSKCRSSKHRNIKKKVKEDSLYKKPPRISERFLVIAIFTTKNLSEWRDNLLGDDSIALSHVLEYREKRAEVKTNWIEQEESLR
jgi:hypothetical protein